MATNKWGIQSGNMGGKVKSFGDQNKNGYSGTVAESIRSAPEAWASLAKIPGISDTLKENPELIPQIIDDPKAALDAYNTQAATGGADGGSNGFMQNDSTLGQLNQYVIRDDTQGLPPDVPVEDILNTEKVFDSQVSALEKSAMQLEDSAQAMLKGEIPADVAAQIRQQSSEAALQYGLGTDQAAAALTARDLGLTSMQIKQQGAQQLTQASAMRESAAKLSETSRQFDRQYNLAIDEYQTKVRTLNLQGLALEQDRLQFNAKQNMTILSFMVDMVSKQQELGYKYAAADMDSSGMMESFDSWINEFNSLLG